MLVLVQSSWIKQKCGSHIIKKRISTNLEKISKNKYVVTKDSKHKWGWLTQNSAKCLEVLEFSARNVGPNVYTWEEAKLY